MQPLPCHSASGARGTVREVAVVRQHKAQLCKCPRCWPTHRRLPLNAWLIRHRVLQLSLLRRGHREGAVAAAAETRHRRPLKSPRKHRHHQRRHRASKASLRRCKTRRTLPPPPRAQLQRLQRLPGRRRVGDRAAPSVSLNHQSPPRQYRARLTRRLL